MNIFRLLLVEDNEQDIATCKDTIAKYQDEKQREVEIIEYNNVEEALKGLDNSFDGAIIDLKLADEGNEGNQVINKIQESFFRIPVAILTGTPDATNMDFTYIGVFKKGELGAGYADIVDKFWDLHNTGLTRIMGGRGIIEETLYRVFRQNLLPQKEKWVEYGKIDSARTEKALLRHTLSHLLQLLDDDERCFPEEVYLFPPLTNKVQTGSVVRKENSTQWFVVMNPACDLVVRKNGKSNTDRILIAEIDSQEILFPSFPQNGLSKSQKNELQNAFANKKPYYHWLPKTDFFGGGFLNFRKLSTISKDEFDTKFEVPVIQISPTFVKDIVARFSSYYARQGQPDIDFDKLM